ncbi:MAG TPA: TetR family transcriptional regulator [Solirubrobacteraceae bacterium]|jgi:AcrR family transcriptional regulator|nr:TetR family transcriptional regulator [Solirubrobacteraceae bacterium]
MSNVLAQAQVSDIQRGRMLSAMIAEASRRGAANVAVAHVVARSGVSRRTFYEVFENREECFLAAFDDAIACLAQEVLPFYEQRGSWRERIRAGLVAGLSVLDAQPELARLLVVETLAAGPAALARRERIVALLVEAVEEGRGGAEAKLDRDPYGLTAEGVVGAVLALLHGRLCKQEDEPLLRLTNSLMSVIVLPYLGPAASRRELDRPVPVARERTLRQAPDPLRTLGMRLTYRTVRVLMEVAANPGSSNRTIGDRAGIPDQGQASKLLARLQGFGLIENAGRGLTRGEPNMWTLTQRGWDVHGVISNQLAEDSSRRPVAGHTAAAPATAQAAAPGSRA